MKYHIIRDGWIKVPAADFQIGESQSPIERLMIGLNQVLLQISGKNVLVDTGLGTKWQPEQISLLDFEQPRQLINQIREHGFSEDDIDIVVLTHLHYDHCGGNTRFDTAGKPIAVFPNAKYYVQRTELEFALNPGPDHETDYIIEDFNPLIENGQLELIDGDLEIMSGLKVFQAPGHCPGHQVVLAEREGDCLFFPGDLFSTREHANLVMTTNFDMDRDEILLHRSKWLKKAIKNRWQCVYCHGIRDIVEILERDQNVDQC
ncbi:MAG: MBL fold metallo-hydrolase [Calditrichaeota bacterium]|nr:MBL fold metallo-hydrolase [Calditrichota bacterium]